MSRVYLAPVAPTPTITREHPSDSSNTGVIAAVVIFVVVLIIMVMAIMAMTHETTPTHHVHFVEETPTLNQSIMPASPALPATALQGGSPISPIPSVSPVAPIPTIPTYPNYPYIGGGTVPTVAGTTLIPPFPQYNPQLNPHVVAYDTALQQLESVEGAGQYPTVEAAWPHQFAPSLHAQDSPVFY